MTVTPDSNNPNPGDQFVSNFVPDYCAVVDAVGDRSITYYDAVNNEGPWVLTRSQFAKTFRPGPPVWPDPPVKWGVQFTDGDVVAYMYRESAESLVNDPDETCRLIRYVPEVVER